MKIVKITLIAIILLLANSTKAQTIDETEQWLNEYGKNINLSYIHDDSKASTAFTGFDGEFLNFFIISNYSDGVHIGIATKFLRKTFSYRM